MDSNRINIVHLITELNVGGAEHMLQKLVSRMDSNRFRSIVVSMTDRGQVGEEIMAQGVPVLSLGMALGRPTASGILKLLHFLRHERVDIIQTWLYHADLLGLIMGKMARIKRIIWGIRCSNMEMKNYRFLTALTVRVGGLLSPLADAIIVNSEQGRKFHQKQGYPVKRMLLIPNGFETEVFVPDPSARAGLLRELSLPRDAILIGLVARFDPMKDHGNFLKAASLLTSKDTSSHFIMVGEGIAPHNRELVSLIDNGLLKGRVHLLGVRHDIPRITAALDIACSSSAFGEGFSNTIGEAMSCGVPCVVTNVGDSSQIVGDTGLIVPPKDPEAMAGAWEKLLRKGSSGRKEMGGQARARVVERYGIESVVKQFERFYENIHLQKGRGKVKSNGGLPYRNHL